MMIAVGIGCSNILMSWGQIGLVISFFWDGKFKSKLRQLAQHKRMLAIMGIYLVFVLGLIHNSNWGYAMHDLKIKLPLLLIPFFLFAFAPFSQRELKIIFHTLYLGAGITMFFGLLMYANIVDWRIKDMRNYSPFIAHLRVSTLLVFCIFLSAYFIIKKEERLFPMMVYLLYSIAALVFILLIQSLTGIAALVGCIFIITVYGVSQKQTRKKAAVGLCLFIISTAVLVRLSYVEYNRVHTIEKVDFSKLPLSTIHGAVYDHDTNRLETVNGHYIWINICNWEISREWNKRSKLDYFDKTKKGWAVHGTLIKFLASKGLKKNAEAVQSLSDKEIRAIENGVDNYLNVNPLDLRFRINQIWVELDNYAKNGDPNFLSLASRLETWKIGKYNIKGSPWVGYGTGDVRDQMVEGYKKTGSKLTRDHWMNPHQQYLTVALAVGIPGLVIFVLLVFFPLVKFKKLHPLLIIFITIAGISMLDEDTLETQAGCTQFVFLYVITYAYHLVYTTPVKGNAPLITET
jgi:O-antigen ligase